MPLLDPSRISQRENVTGASQPSHISHGASGGRQADLSQRSEVSCVSRPLDISELTEVADCSRPSHILQGNKGNGEIANESLQVCSEIAANESFSSNLLQKSLQRISQLPFAVDQSASSNGVGYGNHCFFPVARGSLHESTVYVVTSDQTKITAGQRGNVSHEDCMGLLPSAGSDKPSGTDSPHKFESSVAGRQSDTGGNHGDLNSQEDHFGYINRVRTRTQEIIKVAQAAVAAHSSATNSPSGDHPPPLVALPFSHHLQLTGISLADEEANGRKETAESDSPLSPSEESKRRMRYLLNRISAVEALADRAEALTNISATLSTVRQRQLPPLSPMSPSQAPSSIVVSPSMPLLVASSPPHLQISVIGASSTNPSTSSPMRLSTRARSVMRDGSPLSGQLSPTANTIVLETSESLSPLSARVKTLSVGSSLSRVHSETQLDKHKPRSRSLSPLRARSSTVASRNKMQHKATAADCGF